MKTPKLARLPLLRSGEPVSLGLSESVEVVLEFVVFGWQEANTRHTNLEQPEAIAPVGSGL